MAVTFEDARRIVADDQGPGWPVGTFMVDEQGLEDERFYAVVYGARESIVDMNLAYTVMDLPVALVNKETGELAFEQFLSNPDRFSAMTAVSVDA